MLKGRDGRESVVKSGRKCLCAEQIAIWESAKHGILNKIGGGDALSLAN